MTQHDTTGQLNEIRRQYVPCGRYYLLRSLPNGGVTVDTVAGSKGAADALASWPAPHFVVQTVGDHSSAKYHHKLWAYPDLVYLFGQQLNNNKGGP